MARRIKSNASKRYMGSRTWGAGNMKNRRGKGNRGGVGRAGLGKHHWLWKIKNEGTQTPKGFFNVSRRPAPTVGLEELARGIERGTYPKDSQGVSEVDVKTFKVLGDGRFTHKARVHALAFSVKAQQKIEAAGGQAVKAE